MMTLAIANLVSHSCCNFGYLIYLDVHLLQI